MKYASAVQYGTSCGLSGAQLSPATREFMTFAERRLDALAERLQTDPPRRRAPLDT